MVELKLIAIELYRNMILYPRRVRKQAARAAGRLYVIGTKTSSAGERRTFNSADFGYQSSRAAHVICTRVLA